MQSASFSEWSVTFYREDAVSKFLRMVGDFLPEHVISNINYGSSSDVASVLSDSDVQPMWPSWMYGLYAFGPLRTCVQLTSDLCVTVERHILLAGRQVLVRFRVWFHEDVGSVL